MASTPGKTFMISSDCDHTGADDLLAMIRQQVDAASPGTPLALDLTEGRPTAIALQIAAAAARSLARKDAFAGYGETAAQLLAPVTDR